MERLAGQKRTLEIHIFFIITDNFFLFQVKIWFETAHENTLSVNKTQIINFNHSRFVLFYSPLWSGGQCGWCAVWTVWTVWTVSLFIEYLLSEEASLPFTVRMTGDNSLPHELTFLPNFIELVNLSFISGVLFEIFGLPSCV